MFAPGHVEDWFTANGSPIPSLDQAPAAFNIEAILACADAFHVQVAGPPPTQ